MPDRRIHPSLQPRALRWLIGILVAAISVVTVLALSQGKAPEAPLQTAMAAVFSVHSADDADTFLGSAFLWGERAEVAVTNAHVIKTARTVRLRDATGIEEIATVIARDAVRDVAVIAVRPDRRGLAPATAPLGLGAEVWALGAPLGVEFTVTGGTISALSRQVDPAAPIRMLQHDAAVNPGSSGGPLVDGAGHLVGMNSRIADGSRMFVGIAYAIPADQLGAIVAGLAQGTLPTLPRLGLRARPVDRQLASVLGIAPTGLLVDEVEAAGLAEQAGLLPGDVLLAVAGKAIDKPGDLPFALERAQRATGAADMTVLRGGAVVVLSVALPEDGPLPSAPPVAPPQRVQSYSLASLGLQMNGTRIGKVQVNSAAGGDGLAAGDQILMLDGKPVVAATLAATVLTAPALFLVRNVTGTRHVLVDPWSKAAGLRPSGGANVLDPDVVVF